MAKASKAERRWAQAAAPSPPPRRRREPVAARPPRARCEPAARLARDRAAACYRAPPHRSSTPAQIVKPPCPRHVQVQARKEKESAREGIIASLNAHRMEPAKLKLLASSCSIGQTQSKRQQLQRALYAKKQGAALDDLVSLEVEREQPRRNDPGREELSITPLHGQLGLEGVLKAAAASDGAVHVEDAPRVAIIKEAQKEHGRRVGEEQTEALMQIEHKRLERQAARKVEGVVMEKPSKNRKEGGKLSVEGEGSEVRKDSHKHVQDEVGPTGTAESLFVDEKGEHEDDQEGEEEGEEEEGEEKSEGESDEGDKGEEGEAGEECESEETEVEAGDGLGDAEDREGKPLSALAQAILGMLDSIPASDQDVAALSFAPDAPSVGIDEQTSFANADWDSSAKRRRGVLQMPRAQADSTICESKATGQVAGPFSRAGAFYVKVRRNIRVQEQREQLPIFAEEQTIMEAISQHDAVILCGETGSGKTTQVPQFLYEAGYGHPSAHSRSGMVGVTQPRRVAALSMAQRVAHELNSKLGEVVAYQIRYDSTVSKRTRIKFMTDGILLREVSEDLLLSKYSCIIIDEAHERGVNIDLLLGILSRVITMRRERFTRSKTEGPGPLKLVIMSATLQVDTFAKNEVLFKTAPPVIKVAARQYPVTVHFNRSTPDDHLPSVLSKIVKIHCRLPAGGILVFLTGKREIDYVVQKLRKRFGNVKARNANHDSNTERASSNAPDEARPLTATSENDADANLEDDDAVREAEEAEAEVAKFEADAHQSVLEDQKGRLIGEEEEEDESAEASDALEKDTDATEDLTKPLVSAELNDQASTKMAEETGEGGQGPEEVEYDFDLGEGEDVDEDVEGESNPVLDDEEEDHGGPVWVLPLYSMLPACEQMRVWRPPPRGSRLIVVATNVAETSITIPNISYVVDCGKHKQRVFDERSGVSRYDLQWVSQASAEQRAGRAGRVGPGHCYRIYSSSVFANVFPPFSEPEIRRVPVEGIVLQMKTMGLLRVHNFPFPEPPSSTAINSAIISLTYLGAISGSAPDAPATGLGRMLARFPIAPRLAKLIIVSRRMGLVGYGLILAAMLAQQDPYDNHSHQTGQTSVEMEEDEDQEEGIAQVAAVVASTSAMENTGVDAEGEPPQRWKCPTSEALNLLGAYLQWQTAGSDERAALRCCLVPKVLKEAMLLTHQLRGLLSVMFPNDPPVELPLAAPSFKQVTELCRALAYSLPDRVARLASLCSSAIEQEILSRISDGVKPALMRKAYMAADQLGHQLLWLPPRSEISSHKPRPKYVVFYEVNEAKRPYMTLATTIDPGWLPDASAALTTLGPPCRELAPRYERSSDAPLCWFTPKYGSANWILPPVPRPPPAEDTELRGAIFARLLCTGQVFSAIQPLAAQLEARVRPITHTVVTDRALLTLRSCLCEKKAFHASDIAAIWETQPRFLLREIAVLLPHAARSQLVEIWPEMLVQAERGRKARLSKRQRD